MSSVAVCGAVCCHVGLSYYIALYSLSILCGRFAKYQICYAMCYETRLAVPRSGGRTCPYDSGCEFCVGGKLGSPS